MKKRKVKSLKLKVKAKNLKFYFAFFIFSLFTFSFKLCFGQPVSSTELINQARLYDGKTVVYEGEVIGDIMVRGDYAWVNLHDGTNAIGIWVPKGLIKDITYEGSYKSRGDWIEITGIFHRACPQHGGDLDIHCQGIRKISSGKQLSEHLNIGKRNFIFILAGLLCLILILRQLKIT